jgi:hypothetical protein
VVVAYTLMKVWDKLEREVLQVEGETVILDIGTNDVQGTGRVPQSGPGDVGWRYERVGRLLFEKGAVGLVACEMKPMSFMDVAPYLWVIRSACLMLRTHGHHVHGCTTQTCVSHLRKDGYHILPSFSTVLDMTYACAIRGILVPCPAPSWDRGQDPALRDKWPTPRRHRANGKTMGAVDVVLGSACALCGVCGRVMRDVGVAVEWVLCTGCMGGALPF